MHRRVRLGYPKMSFPVGSTEGIIEESELNE